MIFRDPTPLVVVELSSYESGGFLQLAGQIEAFSNEVEILFKTRHSVPRSVVG